MSEASALERQMLDLINAERAANGLDPVQLELRLNDSAEDHSKWMLQQDVFSHTGSGGSSAGDRMADAGFVFSGSWRWSENIAWQSERGEAGLEDDVIDLHNALMNSPGHRANILDPNVTVVGIGIELGEFNGHTAVMVTQNFARTSAPLQIDGGAAAEPVPTEPAPVEPAPEEPDVVEPTPVEPTEPAPVEPAEPAPVEPEPVADVTPTQGSDVITLEAPTRIHTLRGRDHVTGSEGNDTILGGHGRDQLFGEEGNDRLFGGRHADQLFGGEGHDRLFGGGGRDKINGGEGNDRLVGGAGSDTFIFSEGVDRVMDFDRGGVDDFIDLRGADGITSFADMIENHAFETRHGHLRITDDDGDVLVLRKTELSEIDASDFLF